MAESRPLTLLRLATVASCALVPVLLGVLVVVGMEREADTTIPARNSDRHVSVRHVAALKTFEYAIVRRDRVAVGPLSAAALLERIPQCRAAWSGQGNALARMQRWLSHANASESTPASSIATELESLDRTLLRFSSGDNRRVADKVGLDGARWADAVTHVLATPIEASDYPGRRFTVQCGDIARAVFALSRANGRMLATLAWRGTEVERVTARWRPDQYVEIAPREIARANPWAGIPGCIYVGHASNDAASYFVGGIRGLDDRLCNRPEMRGIDANATVAAARRIGGEPTPDMAADDERWRIPPSLSMMLQPLEALHRPGGALYHPARRKRPARGLRA